MDGKDHVIVVSASQNRSLIMTLHKLKQLSWGSAFKDLFNAGWRGPMDSDGFPTRIGNVESQHDTLTKADGTIHRKT